MGSRPVDAALTLVCVTRLAQQVRQLDDLCRNPVGSASLTVVVNMQLTFAGDPAAWDRRSSTQKQEKGGLGHACHVGSQH